MPTGAKRSTRRKHVEPDESAEAFVRSALDAAERALTDESSPASEEVAVAAADPMLAALRLEEYCVRTLELGRTATFHDHGAAQLYYHNTIERLFTRFVALLDQATEALSAAIARGDADVRQLATAVNALSNQIVNIRRVKTVRNDRPDSVQELDRMIEERRAQLQARRQLPVHATG